MVFIDKRSKGKFYEKSLFISSEYENQLLLYIQNVRTQLNSVYISYKGVFFVFLVFLNIYKNVIENIHPKD